MPTHHLRPSSLNPTASAPTRPSRSRLLGLVPSNTYFHISITHPAASSPRRGLTILNLVLMPALGHRFGRLACTHACISSVSFFVSIFLLARSRACSARQRWCLRLARQGITAHARGTNKDAPPPVSPSWPSIPPRPPAGAPAMPAVHPTRQLVSVFHEAGCIRRFAAWGEAD